MIFNNIRASRTVFSGGSVFPKNVQNNIILNYEHSKLINLELKINKIEEVSIVSLQS